MIRVTVETVEHQYHSMTVVGHAETGESGFDLVCAGVSSILTGALNAFDEMDDDAIKDTRPSLIQIQEYKMEDPL